MTLRTRAEIIEVVKTAGWQESSLFGYYFIHQTESTRVALGLGRDTWSLARATEKPGVFKVFAEGLTVADFKTALDRIDNEQPNTANAR